MPQVTSTSIDVGEFRSRVTFLNNNPIASTSGGNTDNYSSFLTCWGRLRQNNGSRNLSFGEITLENTYTLFVRYQDTLAEQLKSNTIIQIDTRTFIIQSTTKVDELDFFYSFTLTQKDH